MNYGLYLSATGVLTNSYRQDVIANNLANSETVGFKRNIAQFQERLTESQQQHLLTEGTNPLLENLGGGLFALPTSMDTSQGELEATGNNKDVAIEGAGYFAVQDRGQTYLTRDGRFQLDQNGNLIRSSDREQKVLDANLKPIVLDPRAVAEISTDGTISQNGTAVAKLGTFQASNPADLKQVGGNLLNAPELEKNLVACPSAVHSGFVERGNVDPAQELASLMDSQRELEANANMIRYQDETLGQCVNSVGKIS